MQYTNKAHMKKPEYTDPVDINDLNENFDVVDGHMGSAIATKDGVHGIRFNPYSKRMEAYDEDTGSWVDAEDKDWGLELNFGTLEETSWENISLASSVGMGANFWAVGDTKSVLIHGTVGTLEIDKTLYVYILGFDHNSELEGGGIHFGTFKTAAVDGVDVALCAPEYGTNKTDGTLTFNMSHWGNSNHGGWIGCDMRYDILGSTDVAPSDYGTKAVAGRTGYNPTATVTSNPVANTLMAALPAELRAVMKPMKKYTDTFGGSSNVDAHIGPSIDYLPLLAEYEIFGARTRANQYEKNYQKQYDYYAAGNSRIKYKDGEPETAAIWWERSPNYSGAAIFCFVSTTGAAYGYGANNSRGLAPAFKI